MARNRRSVAAEVALATLVALLATSAVTAAATKRYIVVSEDSVARPAVRPSARRAHTALKSASSTGTPSRATPPR